MDQIKPISWQRAVAEMTEERIRAEAAAGLIRRLARSRDVAAAELTYGDGRAAIEGVVSALVIALRSGSGVESPADLEARMNAAVVAREALGQQARALAATIPTEKSVVVDLLKPVLPDLLSSLGALWSHWTKGEAELRETIAERLEAARWPAFTEIGSG